MALRSPEFCRIAATEWPCIFRMAAFFSPARPPIPLTGFPLWRKVVDFSSATRLVSCLPIRFWTCPQHSNVEMWTPSWIGESAFFTLAYDLLSPSPRYSVYCRSYRSTDRLNSSFHTGWFRTCCRPSMVFSDRCPGGLSAKPGTQHLFSWAFAWHTNHSSLTEFQYQAPSSSFRSPTALWKSHFCCWNRVCAKFHRRTLWHRLDCLLFFLLVQLPAWSLQLLL